MRRSAVIFMLIFTLIIANICTGCGGTVSESGADSGGAAESSPGTSQSGTDSRTTDADDGAGRSGQAEPAGKTGQSGKTTDASSIPDTNESAAGSWGVADPETASESPKADTSADGSAVPAFSQVLVDNEELYFAIKDVKPDASLGYTWKVYIENRTEQNLMFSFEKVSVNGVMCDPFWAEVITAGKKGNCEISWMRDSLQARQIEDVTQVDFTLNVYNDDDYTEAPLMHDPFTVFPMGEERALPVVREPAETDQVLVDNENCTVIITGYEPDNSWGYAMHLYLRNKTDKDLVFSVADSSINGIMCDPFWAEIVCAGKSSISTVLWDKNALEENEITEVKQISLPMLVYADDDIGNPYVDETFELTPGGK